MAGRARALQRREQRLAARATALRERARAAVAARGDAGLPEARQLLAEAVGLEAEALVKTRRKLAAHRELERALGRALRGEGGSAVEADSERKRRLDRMSDAELAALVGNLGGPSEPDGRDHGRGDDRDGNRAGGGEGRTNPPPERTLPAWWVEARDSFPAVEATVGGPGEAEAADRVRALCQSQADGVPPADADLLAALAALRRLRAGRGRRTLNVKTR